MAETTQTNPMALDEMRVHFAESFKRIEDLGWTDLNDERHFIEAFYPTTAEVFAAMFIALSDLTPGIPLCPMDRLVGRKEDPRASLYCTYYDLKTQTHIDAEALLSDAEYQRYCELTEEHC